MYRYLMIESKTDISAYETTIISLFSEFIELAKVEVLNKQIWMYYDQELDISLKDVVLNLSTDTLTDFRLYHSSQFETLSALEVNRFFIEQKLTLINFNTYVFIDNHVILKHFLKSLDISYKPHILKKYTNDTQMLDTVRVYLESNQNMSVAAKALYVHRNTLIQRLDKFYHVTEFDVKTFIDGFLIYHLLLTK